MLRKFLSRITSHTPWLFYNLKKIDLAVHHYLGLQYEPDFLYFQELARLHANLVIVDIGANIGQSAVGFANLFREATIYSFEANPDLEAYLLFCQSIIGGRFNYQMVGLSSSPTELPLYIPRRGKVLIYGEASVDKGALDDPEVKRRIGHYDIAERVVRLIKFDELKLQPDIVKIDVQGHELSVLNGMEMTIDKFKPVFLIERSTSERGIRDFLESKGYALFLPSSTNRTLIPYDAKLNTVNMFAIPTGTERKMQQINSLLRPS